MKPAPATASAAAAVTSSDLSSVNHQSRPLGDGFFAACGSIRSGGYSSGTRLTRIPDRAGSGRMVTEHTPDPANCGGCDARCREDSCRTHAFCGWPPVCPPRTEITSGLRSFQAEPLGQIGGSGFRCVFTGLFRGGFICKVFFLYGLPQMVGPAVKIGGIIGFRAEQYPGQRP